MSQSWKHVVTRDPTRASAEYINAVDAKVKAFTDRIGLADKLNFAKACASMRIVHNGTAL